MQTVSSRIWTRVAKSISYDDNHYTTSASTYTCVREMHFLSIGYHLDNISLTVNIFLKGMNRGE